MKIYTLDKTYAETYFCDECEKEFKDNELHYNGKAFYCDQCYESVDNE